MGHGSARQQTAPNKITNRRMETNLLNVKEGRIFHNCMIHFLLAIRDCNLENLKYLIIYKFACTPLLVHNHKLPKSVE